MTQTYPAQIEALCATRSMLLRLDSKYSERLQWSMLRLSNYIKDISEALELVRRRRKPTGP